MKVLVADDNPVVRMGLKVLLERGADVTEVVEAVDGRDAVQKIRSESPDVALLDVRMPHLDGLGVLEEIGGNPPSLMLTHSEEPDIIRLALERGARGYLVHGRTTPEEIFGALRTCVSGGLVLSAPAAEALAGNSTAHEPAAPQQHPFAELLTPGELTVLEAAAGGADNTQIAREQFLSARTVKNYLNSAYGKLGVHSRAEAVAAWFSAREGGAH